MSVDTEIDTLSDPEGGHSAAPAPQPERAEGRSDIDWRRLRDRFVITRRGLIATGIVLAAALLYSYLCWILANTTDANSDAANISLQGWDVWHGNPMLRHWVTGDANFYTFETPLYAVVEWVMGLRATTVHVVASLTYTLVMLSAAWLAKGEERGMRAWVRFGLVAAFLAIPVFMGDLVPTLLDPPDHIGTAVFILLAYLLCDRATGRRGATWCLFALLVLGQLGDATVKYVAVYPVVLVCVTRPLLARRLKSPELWMAFAAAASIPGEAILRAAMRTWGAYSMVPPKTKMADSKLWLGHLHSTLLGLMRLFNIPTRTTGLSSDTPAGSFWVVAALLGAFVLLAAVYGFVRTVARWPRAAAADQLLAVGIPVYLAAYAFSTMVAPGAGGAYEFLGVVPMIVALGVRNLPLPAPRRLPVLVAAAGLATVAILATGIGPGLVSPQQRLAGWLQAHGLKYGLGQYWNASSVTADSGDAVAVRAVVPAPPHVFAAYAWVTNATWFNPAAHDAQFFVANEGLPGYRIEDVEAAFGKPVAIYHVDYFDVMVYRTNLLRRVPQVLLPNF